MIRSPAAAAGYLLVAFAATELALTMIPGIEAWRAGVTDMLVWSVPVTAWIVGPAAVAAVLTARARSRGQAWLFLGAEATVIAMTAALSAIIFADRSAQNAQSVVALMMLPIAQYLCLASFATAVFGFARLRRA